MLGVLPPRKNVTRKVIVEKFLNSLIQEKGGLKFIKLKWQPSYRGSAVERKYKRIFESFEKTHGVKLYLKDFGNYLHVELDGVDTPQIAMESYVDNRFVLPPITPFIVDTVPPKKREARKLAF